MQEKYTVSAQRALRLAEENAVRGGAGSTGTEHMLLALVQEKEGTAGAVLRAAGISEAKLAASIDQLIHAGGNTRIRHRGQFTPRMEKILRSAQQQAEYFLCHDTGTEHILLALMRDSDSSASRLRTAGRAVAHRRHATAAIESTHS